MSKSRITVEDQNGSKTIVIVQNTLDEIFDLLSAEPSDEHTTIDNFLKRTGAVLSIDTPNSSWVDRIEYDAVAKEIRVVPNFGNPATHEGSFEKFLTALRSPSAGKFNAALRRGEI